MADNLQSCDNCKRQFNPNELEWIGYYWYCPDCNRAFWDGADGALKALRCGWITSYTDRATYDTWASSSNNWPAPDTHVLS